MNIFQFMAINSLILSQMATNENNDVVAHGQKYYTLARALTGNEVPHSVK